MTNTNDISSNLGTGHLTIIIPYRDRLEHLREFVPHIDAFLRFVDFTIIVVNQLDSKPFNRGKLLNIGYILARDAADWVVFHDVDMLPCTPECDYSRPEHVRHIAERVQQFDYQMPYEEYLGGVVVASKPAFELINGFSNEYWGWGGEDDELCVRCRVAGVPIERSPGRYICLPHDRPVFSLSNQDRFKRTVVDALDHRNDGGTPEQVERPGAFGMARSLRDWVHDWAGSGADYRTEGLNSVVYDIVARDPLHSVLGTAGRGNPHDQIVSVRL